MNQWMQSSGNRRIAVPPSPEASELVDLGVRRSWSFRPIGQAPLLERPHYLDGWWFLPVQEDTSALPARTLKRVGAIYEAGLRPRGFIVAHESPPMLMNVEATARSERGRHFDLDEMATRVQQGFAHAFSRESLLGRAAPLVLSGVLFILKGAVVVLGVCGVLAVVALDPVLIAVTEDGYWVEIDRWQA